jgi:hypothetical protein
MAILLAILSNPLSAGDTDQPGDTQIAEVLASHQYDLNGTGRDFLLHEAASADFFLLGELHGDNQIPALLRTIWPEMWKQGYRHIAAELSPWAAQELELPLTVGAPKVLGLWTKQEAADAHSVAAANETVLWGCDMEEEQPQFLIRALAHRNSGDLNLRRMAELTKESYERKLAPTLLELAKTSHARSDQLVNGISLRENLLATLEIDANRLSPGTKMIAQNEREQLMKRQFLEHYRYPSTDAGPRKVLLRFGRNHLHRGYDARGISTLGNFVAEFAIAEAKTAFNLGAFGAGGKAALMGDSWDADERQDELAFTLLAEKAKYPATVFDLRPLRAILHQIPQEKLSALETNLIYWADSYDALICYKTVTPREQ